MSLTEPGSVARYRQVAAIRERGFSPAVTYPLAEYIECRGPCDERERMAEEEERIRTEEAKEGSLLERESPLLPGQDLVHVPVYG